MLRADIKAAWVEALRSGDYAQGNMLRSERNPGKPEFCCLGVLLDLGDDGKWCNQDEGIYYTRKGGMFESFHGGRLLGEMLAYIGLTQEQESYLINMNDGGKPFAEIATYIEENL